MGRILLRLTTHGIAVFVGFALGIYLLPILTSPPAPDQSVLEEMAQDAIFSAEFAEDLPGNDFLHWGRGTVTLTKTSLVHNGELAPGPDYIAYLVPQFVEDENAFEPLKAQSLPIGAIKTFKGFALDLPQGVDLEAYNTVLIWCEAFSEFIAAAQYR